MGAAQDKIYVASYGGWMTLSNPSIHWTDESKVPGKFERVI